MLPFPCHLTSKYDSRAETLSGIPLSPARFPKMPLRIKTFESIKIKPQGSIPLHHRLPDERSIAPRYHGNNRLAGFLSNSQNASNQFPCHGEVRRRRRPATRKKRNKLLKAKLVSGRARIIMVSFFLLNFQYSPVGLVEETQTPHVPMLAARETENLFRHRGSGFLSFRRLSR